MLWTHSQIGLLIFALGLVGFGAWGYIGRRGFREKALDLEEEIRRLKAAPQTLEYRIERYDVLWFPAITVLPQSREVVGLVAGVPHCKACVRPLSMLGGKDQWSCAKCGSSFPGSLVDVMVMDSVTQQALNYFRERHGDYKVSLGRKNG